MGQGLATLWEGTHLGGSLRLVCVLLCYQLSGSSGSCSQGPRSPSLRAQSLAAGTLLAIASYCSLPFYGLTTEAQRCSRSQSLWTQRQAV